VVAVLALLVLSGCASQTKRATGVTATSATLNGVRQCVGDVDSYWTWQWRELGTTAWYSGGTSQQNCPGRTQAFSHNLGGLKPDTSYQYRLLVNFNPIDSTGTVNGTRYDTFVTQPQCDDVQGAGESLSAFVGSNPAGSAGDRRVLCVRQGSQSIGQTNGLKAWSTLTTRGEADGTKQPASLQGNLGLGNRGATVEDLSIVGCYRQSGCGTDRDKTVDVRADDAVLRNLDITQKGGRNHDILQCVLIANGNPLVGVRIEFSKIHSCGSESSGNMEHGIYCSDARAPMIKGNWLYDNEGYGIQLYPDCDGALAVGNVVAENGGACDVDGSTSVGYVGGFCGFGRENFPSIHCGPTSGSQAIDMVLYDPRSASSATDCGGGRLSSRGTLQTDPQFVNRGAYDFRMRNPFARAKLGIYSQILPGPRW
jgi:Right handed beta helix region